MNEKVKLPRNVIDTFRPALDSPHYKRLGSLTPIRIISDMYNHTLEGVTNDVAAWLNDYDNQWLLIDALHYGYYEGEPEPLWGIKAGSYYLNEHDTKFTDLQHARGFFFRSNALFYIDQLGFGEVVDLNKEGKDDD